MKRGWIAGSMLAAALLAVGIVRYENGGSVEHLVALPGYPEHLAVDQRTGRVFVTLAPTSMGALSESVAVLDSGNGTLLRTVQTSLRAVGEGCCYLGVLADELTGRVFASSTGDPRLLMLDARGGDVLATVPDASPLAGGLLLSRDQRRALAVRTWSPYAGVRVLDARSGALLRRIACPGAGNIFAQLGMGAGSPVVEYQPLQRLFIGAAVYPHPGSGVCMIDPLRGTMLWIRIGASRMLIDGLALDERTARVFVAAHDAYSNSASGIATILDARTGHIIRTARIGPAPYQFAIAARTNHVFILNADGYVGSASLSIVDAGTGRLLRTLPTRPMPVSLSIDPRTGRPAIGYQDGSTDWLDPRNGRTMLHTNGSAQSLWLGADARTDRTFTATFDDGRAVPTASSIQVRDTHTGRILRVIAVSGAVGPMAIDSRRHRGFVAIAGCTGHSRDTWGWLPGWLRGRLPWVPAPSAPAGGCILILDTAR